MATVTVQKIRKHHIQYFSFFWFFFIYFTFCSHNLQTEAARAHSSENLFCHIEFTVKISSKLITSNSVTFSFFEFDLGDIDPKNF